MENPPALLPDCLPLFAELDYQRPDLKSFADQARRTKNHFQKWNKAKNLRDAQLRFQHQVDLYYESATLAQIGLARQTGDPFYTEEVSFYQAVEPSVDHLVQSVNVWLWQKSSSPELKMFWGTSFVRHTQAAPVAGTRAGQIQWKLEQEGLHRFLTVAGARTDAPKEPESEAEEAYSPEALFSAFYALVELRRQQAIEGGSPDYLSWVLGHRPRGAYSPQALRQLRDCVVNYLACLAGAVLWDSGTEFSLSDRSNWVRGEANPTGLPCGEYLRQVTQEMSREQSLAPEDLVYGLNSLCNALHMEPDWVLHLQRAGYIDLNPSKSKAEGVECFYLPVSRLPYLFANMTNSPSLLLDLLRETGRCYAYLRSVSESDFTPFIEMGVASGEFIGQVFALQALPHMDRFYGRAAADAVQWTLRAQLLNLLQVAQLDAFQDLVYSEAKGPEDLLRFWKESRKRFFPGTESLWEARAEEELVETLLSGDLAIAPFCTVDRLLAQLAAGQFWDRYRTHSTEGLHKWDQFCALGSRLSFLERLAAVGLDSPLDCECVKRLAYQIGYAMGY